MSIVNGTTYHDGTDPAVVHALEAARLEDRRIRIRFGDVNTGRDWLEEFGVEGRVRRSIGPVKVPVLAHNSRSEAGRRILDNAIVRIEDSRTHRILYSHPKYHTGKITVRRVERLLAAVQALKDQNTYAPLRVEVLVDGKVHARFPDAKLARRWLKKMGLAVK